MIEINNKKLCESCFSEIAESGGEEACPCCGFKSAEYSPDPMVLPMGTKLDNKVIIGRVMGKGGFGITYLGYDPRIDRTIAVKEYYPNGISYRSPGTTEVSVADTKSTETFDKGAEKFYTEAEMVSQFNGNPNIVSVYDYFRTNGTVYLIMEYIHGVTLKNYVDKHGTLSDEQTLYVMDKIVAALSITHSAGVLHRDISPDNIMLCADGKVKLIDFGAARQILAESSSNLTVVMKPGYTPIEQYTKKGKQGAWTDIYSLGVSMYYALTRVIIDDPYERMDDDEEFAENKFGLNGELWEIIKKCTMINAPDRYGSAIELRKALKSVPLSPETISLSADDLKIEPENHDNSAWASVSDSSGGEFPVTEAPGSTVDEFPVTVAAKVAPIEPSGGGEEDCPVTVAFADSENEPPKKLADKAPKKAPKSEPAKKKAGKSPEIPESEPAKKIAGSAPYAGKKRANPFKNRKLIVICSAAAFLIAAALVVLFVVQPFSSKKMMMSGRNIPIKIAMFEPQGGSDALTVQFCGKTGRRAYVCTVIFKDPPKANTTYSSDKVTTFISYSGKDTKVFNDAHQFATLSTELSEVSVGEYNPGKSIELTVSGKTVPDLFGDYDGMINFKVSGKAKLQSGTANTVSEWKKSSIIAA